jgi:hypothetical protein
MTARPSYRGGAPCSKRMTTRRAPSMIWGAAASSRRTTAHPLYTRFEKRAGASLCETAVRQPEHDSAPRCVGRRCDPSPAAAPRRPAPWPGRPPRSARRAPPGTRPSTAGGGCLSLSSKGEGRGEGGGGRGT